MWEKLQGYKTYIVAIASITGALAAYVNGTINIAELLQAISVALLSMTIRHGITTSGEQK